MFIAHSSPLAAHRICGGAPIGSEASANLLSGDTSLLRFGEDCQDSGDLTVQSWSKDIEYKVENKVIRIV